MAALRRFPRFLLLISSVIFLMLGLFAGLARLGWQAGSVPPALSVIHGPLMVCGFLGTLICLERAVALGRWWGYLAPLITAIGTLALVAGAPTTTAILLIAVGSLALVSIFAAVLLKQFTFHHLTMSIGAAAWLVGNLLWFLGATIPQMVQWWIAFLVLTIAGERLELNRLLAPSRYARLLFCLGLALFLFGMVFASFIPVQGHRIVGVGTLTLALWLARFDVARFTVRRPGLPRFVALCLFGGYAWLGVGSLIWILAVPGDAAGSFSFFAYDAALHTIFLGFVFSMIFAHAPIVFPAVIGRPLPFRHAFYSHVVLLHFSLILRVGGDLAGSFPLMRWAGFGNAITLVLFLMNNALSLGAPKNRL